MVGDRQEYRAFIHHDDISSYYKAWWQRLRPWISLWVEIIAESGVVRMIYRRRRLLMLLGKIILGIIGFLLGHAYFASSYTHPPAHYHDLATRCTFFRSGCGNVREEKIFIPVALHDPTGDLAGGKWGSALLSLINILGPENVFLSIYENDSGPTGRAKLEALERQLTCRHSIVIDDHVALDGFPTVILPDGTPRVKRTVYLSEMRNRALRPLETFSPDALGTTHFDRVLFLNDVIFRPLDAAHLLFNTNRGRDGHPHYLAACALDYYWDPFMSYDTYAQRDAEGYQMGEQVFPIFSAAGKSLSRRAMLAQSDAVPVKSCWGGMVAMRAQYIQASPNNTTPPTTLPSRSNSEIRSFAIDPDHVTPPSSPLRFRGEPEIFYDACECCLFMADLSSTAVTLKSDEQGIYVNPYVRVAYSRRVLWFIRWAKYYERSLSIPQRILTFFKGKPILNPYRLVEPGQAFREEVWVRNAVRDRSQTTGAEPERIQSKRMETAVAGKWQMVERKGRPGLFCGIRNMQVMRARDERQVGSSWETVAIPPGQSLKFRPGYN